MAGMDFTPHEGCASYRWEILPSDTVEIKMYTIEDIYRMYMIDYTSRIAQGRLDLRKESDLQPIWYTGSAVALSIESAHLDNQHRFRKNLRTPPAKSFSKNCPICPLKREARSINPPKADSSLRRHVNP